MAEQRVICSAGSNLCFLCIVLLPLAAPVQATPVYTILPANTAAYGINDNGAVTGHYSDGGGFLRTPDGTITSFHAPGDAQGTYGISINTDDTIAGYFSDASGVAHGFVRNSDGTLSTFDAPGAGTSNGLGTFARCITAPGAVVGYYFDKAGLAHGFLRTPDGAVTGIDVTGATETEVMGANDKGAIAGLYADRNGLGHGFERNPRGKVTKFDVPGDTLSTLVAGINDNGDIAGRFLDGSGMGHGYIRFADGTFTTFDAPGSNTTPLAINSKGDTTGLYFIHEGKRIIGFVRKSDGKMTSWKVPNAGGGTFPQSINTAGTIAGIANIKINKTTYTESGFIRTP